MKILIAGDSFCSALCHEDSKFAWTQQLGNILPGSAVTCVGQGASSVFSALLQVKKQLSIDSSYDTVIVLITNQDRLYQTVEPIISTLRMAMIHKELYKKSNLNDDRIFNKIEATRMYYEHLYEREFHTFMLDACLKELQSVCDNRRLILFPAFPVYAESVFAGSLLNNHGFSLLDVCGRENTEYDKQFGNDSWRGGFTECQALGDSQIGKINHMSAKNQAILARYFAETIRNGKSALGLNDFEILPKEDFNLYYKPIGQLTYKGADF
jgi:hypothetical protein